MWFSGYHGMIQASSGYIVPNGSDVRHNVSSADDGTDSAVVTLVLADPGAGGSELFIDLPEPVATEVISNLREAIGEIREEREQHDEHEESASCSEPG